MEFSDLDGMGGQRIDSSMGPIDMPFTRFSSLEELDDISYHTVVPEELDVSRYASEEAAQEALEAHNASNDDRFTSLDYYAFVPEENLYVVDHHNQVLNAWLAAEDEGLLEGETALVHVDAHRDDQDPGSIEQPYSVRDAVETVSDEMDISEFIVPAERWGLIDDTYFWGDGDLNRSMPDPEYESAIFDLDLDVFIPLMKKRDRMYAEGVLEREEFDEYSEQIYREMAERIRDADVSTVATSPGYIPQDVALHHLEGINRCLREESSV